jgi:BolA protein
MFRRYALGFSNVSRQLSTMGSATPLEDAIRAKVCSDSSFIQLQLATVLQLHTRSTMQSFCDARS